LNSLCIGAMEKDSTLRRGRKEAFGCCSSLVKG
jgi:hypothetical protein